MYVFRSSTSCGVKELGYIGYKYNRIRDYPHPDPIYNPGVHNAFKIDLKEIESLEEELFDGLKPFFTASVWAPITDIKKAAFITWSHIHDHPRSHELMKWIKEKGWGTISVSEKSYNENSRNYIRFWLWTPNWKKIGEWYEAYRNAQALADSQDGE